MPDSSATAQVALDGRLARSVRTRRAIVDALRSLHHDGDLLPTAPRVAERAGVSLRTVWQHFDDLESLFVEAGRRDFEIALGFVVPIDPAWSLRERIDALVTQRARMFEEMSPVWRAARLKAPFSPQLRANRDLLVEMGRGQIEEAFRRELAEAPDRPTLLVALETACGWSTWECLRTEIGVGAETALAAMSLTVTRLLTPERPR